MSSPFVVRVDWNAYEEMPRQWREGLAELIQQRERLIKGLHEGYYELKEWSALVDLIVEIDDALREQLLHVAEMKLTRN